MRQFEDLSRQGRIRRIRGIARAALDAYGLSDARLTFLEQAGNTLFLVNEPDPVPTGKPDLYKAGQYVLRVHQPGYQTPDAIELELTWLSAMCREAGLPVPEPIPTLEGKWLARMSVPGVPGERLCSLQRWIKGRFTNRAAPHHYQAQGRLMARLHEFAAGWPVPAGFTKRKYDWEGLFQDDLGEGISAREAWGLLPTEYVATYERVAARVKPVMEDLGKGSEVYGLIHADLGQDANVLFWRGEARAIDFDDSGFGYYLYDLSLALEHCQEDEALPDFRDALLEGYTRVRPIPENQLAHLDLFLAAYYVYLSLWAVTAIQRYPKHKDELLRRIERAFRLVQRYAAS